MTSCEDDVQRKFEESLLEEYERGYKKGYEDAKAEQKWTPVTESTLPVKGKVVVAKNATSTWDFGTYRGYSGDIHHWYWKKNTFKTVYWWMYKEDALPCP